MSPCGALLTSVLPWQLCQLTYKGKFSIKVDSSGYSVDVRDLGIDIAKSSKYLQSNAVDHT